MHKFIVMSAIGMGALTLATAMPAQAAMPGQGGLASTAAAISDTIEIRRGGGKHKGWKSRRAGHPPGWSRGRKVGWGGGGMPPGQAKKHWR